MCGFSEGYASKMSTRQIQNSQPDAIFDFIMGNIGKAVPDSYM